MKESVIMSRVESNKLVVLISAFVVFALLGIAVYVEIENTRRRPKSEEMTAVRDAVTSYLDGGIFTYTIPGTSYEIAVAYDEDKNVLRYMLPNGTDEEQAQWVRAVTTALIDLSVTRQGDLDLTVEGGIHSRGLYTLGLTFEDETLSLQIKEKSLRWTIDLSY
jgi:hypothetical protein